ncbi:MAG TPA: L-2-hydroxyglutarate oxidase [Acidimicrobiia bacterium]|nr:L-2-hydroxyglutarate oxidase [Acidimicrobiia bacterium]
MSDRADFVVIGAGIVGLATARALTDRHPQATIVVLEAEATPGVHQSGHNSGVIHSGLYYTPGSLRARLCVEGRRRMIEFCRTHGIAHDITGKLVVATSADEANRLDRLHTRGNANGLIGLRRLGPGEWEEIEPHIEGVAALHVPEAGVADFGGVTRALADTVPADIRTGWPVTSIVRRDGGWEIAGPAGSVTAERFVACAGLHSDRVADLAGAEPPVRIVPFRGEYFSLSGRSEEMVRHLVYPVPDPRFPFLGVHFTRRIDGVVEVGPNAVPAIGRHHYRGARPDWGEFRRSLTTPGFPRLALRYAGTGLAEIVRSRSVNLYARAARRLLPELDRADLKPAGAGVRAQAVSPDGRLVDDFALLRQDGALHVLNAPSPAATASLAIGQHIASVIDQG